jgi:hypothetical protein
LQRTEGIEGIEGIAVAAGPSEATIRASTTTPEMTR